MKRRILRIRLAPVAALLALSIAVLASTSAPADVPLDAWSYAKHVVPQDNSMLVGANVSALRGSQVYGRIVPALLQNSPRVAALVEDAKKSCGIDATESVQGLAIAANAGTGAVFVSTRGLTQQRVRDCLAKIASADGVPLRPSAPDARGVVDFAGPKEHLYVGFEPNGVFVVGTDPTSKPLLTRMISGKGVDGGTDIGRNLANVNTNAGAWMYLDKTTSEGAPAPFRAGYGSLDVAAGVATSEVVLIVDSPATATDLASQLGAQIRQAADQGSLPKVANSIASSTKITAGGNRVFLRTQVPEGDLASFAALTLTPSP